MNSWRKISDPPSIGRQVLVTDGKMVVLLQRLSYLQDFHLKYYFSLPDYVGGVEADIDGFDTQLITHWMPVPEPPTSSASEVQSLRHEE